MVKWKYDKGKEKYLKLTPEQKERIKISQKKRQLKNNFE
jgi:hypothetical protein